MTERHLDIARRLLHHRSAVGTPTLSGDGSRVAVVVSTTDLDENSTSTRIWVDGAPVTAGPHDSGPCWSPDGRHLAFVSRRGETKGESTLHVLPTSGPGEVRTVCTMPDGLGDVTWSPDGRWLAFTSRTRDARYEAKDERWQSPRKIERFFSRLNGENWVFDRPQHVHVVAVDGTDSPRNLTPGAFQHDGVAWLRDSSGIVTSAARHDTWDMDLASDLYVVPLDGEIRAITEQTGMYSHPSPSPDGLLIAFLGADQSRLYPQNQKVGVIGLDGSDRRWISEGLDRTFAPTNCPTPPVWVDDETILAAAEDRGETHVYRLTLGGDTPEPVTCGPITVTGFDHADGCLVTTRSSVVAPADLWTGWGDDATRTTQVARAFRGWEKFQVPCADGSGDIDVWVMLPDGTDGDGDGDGGGDGAGFPVLLDVHGGPFTQYGEYFLDEAQMQAEAGFVVVLCNPRGGSGRDTAWGHAILGPKHPLVDGGTGWGTVDVDDVMSALDGALDRFDVCDRDRVGMLGGSYGGYMATMLAARHGDRFRAICSERAVNNLLTEEWSSDIGSMFRVEHGPDPVEDPDEYLRMSPSRFARDIHVPMLVIHSEEDWRCPINQAEELWMTLKFLGRDVTFYRFPGENHELSRSGSPVHRQMRAEIILDFFAEHLGVG